MDFYFTKLDKYILKRLLKKAVTQGYARSNLDYLFKELRTLALKEYTEDIPGNVDALLLEIINNVCNPDPLFEYKWIQIRDGNAYESKGYYINKSELCADETDFWNCFQTYKLEGTKRERTPNV